MATRNVGILGLGIMGSAMAANLVRAGFRVIGYDPVPARRRLHARAGGRSARSAAEVFESAGIVIASLPSEQALFDICKELPEKRATTIVVETSTLPIPVKE
jgi:3-hydroxyisobutyrate dehydrogenase-like beta-hydroxyacid dehydrogenase